MSKLKKFFRSCPLPSTEMSKDELSTMVAMSLNKGLSEPMTHEDYLSDAVISAMPPEKIPRAFSALWARNILVNGHFRLSLDAIMFMTMFIRNDRDAAVYFSYVASRANEAGTRDITLGFLSNNPLALGVFTPQEVNNMWEAQMDESCVNGNLLDDPDEWKTYLYGEDAEGKVRVRFSDEDERMMTPEEVDAIGAINEPRAIEGRTYFWAGKQYLSVSTEDFVQLQNK